MEQPQARRLMLVEFARIFGVEITTDDASLDRGVDQIIEFLADIDTLELAGAPPASIYDPAWPKVNGTGS